jgi:hypothetical protein
MSTRFLPGNGNYWAEEVFETPGGKRRDVEAERKALHAKIGELTMERDFLSSKLRR